MIVLSHQDVAAMLPPQTAIEVVAQAMAATSRGEAELPLRSIIDVGGPNKMGIMPGRMMSPACHGIKLVSLYPGNVAAGYSSHQGAVVLFEPDHGTAVAIMDGGPLTALRTAAASAVATRALSRENASILAMVGAGEQARHHLDHGNPANHRVAHRKPHADLRHDLCGRSPSQVSATHRERWDRH
jgi:alanine dehydrogenase